MAAPNFNRNSLGGAKHLQFCAPESTPSSSCTSPITVELSTSPWKSILNYFSPLHSFVLHQFSGWLKSCLWRTANNSLSLSYWNSGNLPWNITELGLQSNKHWISNHSVHVIYLLIVCHTILYCSIMFVRHQCLVKISRLVRLKRQIFGLKLGTSKQNSFQNVFTTFTCWLRLPWDSKNLVWTKPSNFHPVGWPFFCNQKLPNFSLCSAQGFSEIFGGLYRNNYCRGMSS